MKVKKKLKKRNHNIMLTNNNKLEENINIKNTFIKNII